MLNMVHVTMGSFQSLIFLDFLLYFLAPDPEIDRGPPSLRTFEPLKCSFSELEVEVKNSQSFLLIKKTSEHTLLEYYFGKPGVLMESPVDPDVASN